MSLRRRRWTLSDTTSQLVRPEAGLYVGEVKPGQVWPVTVRFVGDPNAKTGARVFAVDVQQIDRDAIVGGVRFYLRTRVPSDRLGGGRRPSCCQSEADRAQ